MIQPNPLMYPGVPKGASEELRLKMKERALVDSYYLATIVLGYNMLRPKVHGPMCAFLDQCKIRRRLIQYPRSHLKTTITTVTKRIQDYLVDSTVRILIIGDTESNAQNHVLKIRNHLDNNLMLRWLFPERVWENNNDSLEWSKKKLYCPTDAVHGEPTFTAIGARGAVVSQHFTHINADDLIGEEEYYSETEMSRTIEWFSGLEALFVPPVNQGQLDIPSTYWKTNDVYAFAEEFYGRGQEAIPTGPYSYQRGEIAVFRRGARDDNGDPIFPEAVTREYLDRLQETNPERYAAQYANNPHAAGVAYFSKDYLRFYEWAYADQVIKWKEPETGKWYEVDVSDLYIVSLCDPHAGGRAGNNRFTGSRAAVMTTGTDVKRARTFILDSWVRKAPTGGIIDEIFRQNDKWLPQVFSIEANGLQKMLKYWIDERVERDRRIAVPYHPFIPKGDKDGTRRIKGLQPLFRAGQIWLQRGMTEILDEYSAYPRGFVDALDCMSQGLDHWNIGFEAVEEEMFEEIERRMMQGRSILTGY